MAPTSVEDLPVALKVPDVAKLLRVGTACVYESIRRNEIPHLKLGRKIVIPRDAFLNWMQSAQATVSHGQAQ